MWCLQMAYANRKQTPTAENLKAILESVVDEHAKVGVDRLVHCVFALPEGVVPSGMKSFYRRGWTGGLSGNDHCRIDVMEAGGYDTIQVMLDRSRQQGMQFLAGLRMNDRHGDAGKSEFGQAHPEWLLKDPKIPALDYRHAGVRQAVLEVAREVLEKYDVDGIELDWMRHCHVFEPAEAEQNAPILTEFVADMRKLLDEAARKRGRGRLLLGVRVAQTADECRALGYDVQAWVQQGTIDYLCPSDFFYNDYNVETEKFVKVTRGTDCKVYPSIHPKIAHNHFHDTPTVANYRANAKNFYAYGADGVSVYNYHYHWRADMGPEDDWPGVMQHLAEVRDPARVARGDRHYMYYPLWLPGKCPTGAQFDKTNTINLRRDQPHGSVTFRMAEDLADLTWDARLEFKFIGTIEGGTLRVRLNGHEYEADRIGSTLVADGRPESAGRALPAYHLYRLPLDAKIARWGDNVLELTWTHLPKSSDEATWLAQEFEVFVTAK